MRMHTARNITAATVLGMWLHAIVYAAVPSPGIVAPVEERPQADIAVHEGKMTARLVTVPLARVIAEVTKVTGARLEWLGGGGEKTVSLSFKELALAQALERILRPRSFLLFWAGTDGVPRLSRIVVLSEADGTASPGGLALGYTDESRPISAGRVGVPLSGLREPAAGLEPSNPSRQRGGRERGSRDAVSDSTPRRDDHTNDFDSERANARRPVAFVAPVAKATPTPDDESGDIPQATATPARACAPRPDATCRGTAATGGASLLMRKETRQHRDLFVWKWIKGKATTKADFGDPLRSTSYSLCIYDGAGNLIGETTASSGCTRGGQACWSETELGFTYRSQDATAGAVRTINLKAGLDGQAKIVLRGRAPNVKLPITTLPVTVNLTNTDGQCWASTYRGRVTTNGPKRFSATAD